MLYLIENKQQQKRILIINTMLNVTFDRDISKDSRVQ